MLGQSGQCGEDGERPDGDHQDPRTADPVRQEAPLWAAQPPVCENARAPGLMLNYSA